MGHTPISNDSVRQDHTSMTAPVYVLLCVYILNRHIYSHTLLIKCTKFQLKRVSTLRPRVVDNR